MNLYSCIRALQTIGGSHPTVNSVGDGSIYTFSNANPTLKYACYFVSQTTHKEDDTFSYYGFNIFYFDRLIDDLESNRLEIQSIGKEVIFNSLKIFCNKFVGSSYSQLSFTPFTQRFTDLCAGVYCTITLKVPKSIVCEEDFKELAIYTGNCKECYDEGYAQGLSQTYEEGFESGRTYQKSLLIATQFTENGTYARENGYHTITVNVDVNKYYNSGYTSGYTDGYEEGYNDGLADCGSDYDEGFDDGYTSGVTDQKNKLTSIFITQNGQYNREDGYNSITVNVPQTGYTQEDIDNAYDSGYTSGTTNQKNKLISTAVTQNGVYSREDGYNSITVNVPQTGSTINNQDKTINISANTSTTITYDNGYTGLGNVSITVNVPQTGYTQQDLDDAYNRGYTDGLNDCGSYENDYLTIEALSGGTLYWKATNSGFTRTIEYRKNNGTWNSVTSVADGSGTTVTTVNAGDLINIRGNNTAYCDTIHQNHFVTDFEFNVYGNIMSLIYGDNFKNQTTLTEQHALCSIFLNCSYLISAENLILPATTLANYCYESMFGGCTSLLAAPVLPATTLADGCYRSMFAKCSNLTTAPELPATTLPWYCYYQMFENCTNLNYIKCLAVSFANMNSTASWVRGVQTNSGTFVKSPDISEWPVYPTDYGHNSSVPLNWTVIDA